MSATYHATMVAADATTDKIDALVAIDYPMVQSKLSSPQRVAHKQ
jgi:hypothetical protein